MDIYIPRKCSATNRLITAKDHASVQIEIAEVSLPSTPSQLPFWAELRRYANATNRFLTIFERVYRSTSQAKWLERKTLSLLQDSCAREVRLTRASTDCSLTEISLASDAERVNGAILQTTRLRCATWPCVHLGLVVGARHFLKQFLISPITCSQFKTI